MSSLTLRRAPPTAAQANTPHAPVPQADGQASRASVAERFQREHARRERARRRQRLLLNLAGIALFLLAWEAIPHVFTWMNPALFPPPSRVLQAALPMIQSGELASHIAASLTRATAGFGIALVLGVTAGFLTARIDFLHHLSEPVLHGFRSVPSLAVVPLAVLWFGIGELPKIALIAWGAFFPIWITTFIGVRDTNIVYLRSAAALGAGRLRTLFLVILPAALPFILAGVRQAIAVSLIVLVAAELSGSTRGIAYMMSLGHQLFQVEIMFIGLVLLGAFGFLADRLFVWTARRLFPWYQSAS